MKFCRSQKGAFQKSFSVGRSAPRAAREVFQRTSGQSIYGQTSTRLPRDTWTQSVWSRVCASLSGYESTLYNRGQNLTSLPAKLGIRPLISDGRNHCNVYCYCLMKMWHLKFCHPKLWAKLIIRRNSFIAFYWNQFFDHKNIEVCFS